MKNLLLYEKSFYLSQHINTSISWLPLDELAFLSARLTKKPIFLSVGYSSCKLCFAKEQEFYEDPALVEEVTYNYVNVKVDGDDRPDIDEAFRAFGYSLPDPNPQAFCITLTHEFVPTNFLENWSKFIFPARPLNLNAKKCSCQTIRADQKHFYAYAYGEILYRLCSEYKKTKRRELLKMAEFKAEELVDSFLEMNALYHKNIDTLKKYPASLRDFNACIQGLKYFSEVSKKEIFLEIAHHMEMLRDDTYQKLTSDPRWLANLMHMS